MANVDVNERNLGNKHERTMGGGSIDPPAETNNEPMPACDVITFPSRHDAHRRLARHANVLTRNERAKHADPVVMLYSFCSFQGDSALPTRDATTPTPAFRTPSTGR